MQSVDVDFGKAINLVDSSIEKIGKIRDEPEKILQIVETDFEGVQWKATRIRHKRVMDGEQERDQPASTAEAQWKRDTFYSVVDTIQGSMKQRFEKNRPLLKSFALFAPCRFPELQARYKTELDLQADIKTFCAVYQLDPIRCADELFSFATTFSKFNFSQITETDKAEESESSDDEDDSNDDYMNKEYGAAKYYGENDDHSDNPLNKTPIQKKGQNTIPSFIDALRLLSFPDYHLVDAYPTLCQVYAIAVAIPISSAFAERSFSALKRVKTRIRSTMVQDRHYL